MRPPASAPAPAEGPDDYSLWYRQDAARMLQAENYEKAYHHHRRVRVVCDLLRAVGVRRILDMGCGDGWQVAKLLRAGFEVTGCDLAPERIERARRFAPQARGYFVADLRRPPLFMGRLECIYLGQVLEHLPEPGAVLARLRQHLRPGGYLVLDTPCRDNPIDDAIRVSGLHRRFPGALEWGLEIDPGHLHFYRLAEIETLLKDAGFELTCSRGAPRLRWNTPRLGNPLNSRPRFWKVLDLLESFMGWIPRYRRTGAVVVVLARRPMS